MKDLLLCILEGAESEKKKMTIIVFVVHGIPSVSTYFPKYNTSSGMIIFKVVFLYHCISLHY